MAFNQTLTFNGLGTKTFTIPEAGDYVIEGKHTIPTISAGAGQSSVVVTVLNGASLIYTGIAGAQGFRVENTAAAGDVMSVVYTSAAASDQGLNKIKATVAVFQGE